MADEKTKMKDDRTEYPFVGEPWTDEHGRTRHTRKTADREAVRQAAQIHNIDSDQASSNWTQITTTKATYDTIEQTLQGDETILDFGAGKGGGARLLRERGYDVTVFEPYPDDPVIEPDHTSLADHEADYDLVIANFVLNVLPQDERDRAVERIGQLLKKGGEAYVTARSDTQHDVRGLGQTDRNVRLGPAEYLVAQSGAYQYGFSATRQDGELRQYLSDLLPECQVEKISIGKRGARISA